MPYAYCRKLDPDTGEVVFDDVRSSWAEGHPCAEIIIRVFRTPKGSAARDPNEGIDLEGIDPGSPSATAEVERRMRNALKYWTDAGLFSIETIVVEIYGEGFLWRLEFIDPRESTKKPIPVKGTF